MKIALYITLLFLTISKSTIAQCSYFTTIKSGAVASHVFAIKSDGTLWAWGANSSGQLGDGTNTNKNTPVQVDVAATWTDVAAGESHTLAIKSNGTLWTWGSNSDGQLGDGKYANKNVPAQVGTDTNWQSVVAGKSHSVAIKTDGTLWAWGFNGAGQLGDGTKEEKRVPVQIGSTSDWASVHAGYYHTFAIKKDSTIWIWGDNFFGQLGNGTTGLDAGYTTPTQVGSASDWASISAGAFHNMAIKNNGTLWVWGSNDFGESGTGERHLTPTQLGVASDWAAVRLGGYHSNAIKKDGSLWAWGYNVFGQLGDGTNNGRSAPVQISSGVNWASVSAGIVHSHGIQKNGSVWIWGENDFGQLGNGNNTAKNTPVLFSAAPAFTNALAPTLATATLQQGQYTMFSNLCAPIVSLATNRNAIGYVAGPVSAKVWVDDVQPASYVKRHYQITPSQNAEHAGGRVTLYFTQAEFDSFNSDNITDLPAYPNDAAGKANLLIEKIGGESSDGSGRPATYPGPAVVINPEDADIVWNAAAERWEVNFDVTGFSGFFVKTVNKPLPVRLVSFEAIESENTALLHWNTTLEDNASHFEIERSADAKHFVKIGQVKAVGESSTSQKYTFTDAEFARMSGTAYYRLRSVDRDGTFALSTIKRLTPKQTWAVYPNPVKQGSAITIRANAPIEGLTLTDIAGKELPFQLKTGNGNSNTVVLDLPAGLYTLRVNTGNGISTGKIVVE